MLRSPTHVPTIPLTQVHHHHHHAQYVDVEQRSAVASKLYHDHYYQSDHQYKQQKQQQQQKEAAAASEEQRKKYHFTKATKTTTTATSAKSLLLARKAAAATNKVKAIDSSKEPKIKNTTTTTTKFKTSTTASGGVALTNVYNSTNSNHNNISSIFTRTAVIAPTTPTTPSSTAFPAIFSSTTTAVAAAQTRTADISMSPTTQTPTRTSLFDSCHRKIRLIGGGPVAFLGGLVAKARRKERDGDQNSTDTKLYLEESVLERKLPEADLKALVDLPAGLDYNEWLASHTLALFEHVNLVYGTVSEFCTPSGCPDMTGPGNRTYLWFDEKGKKTRVAAPQYIDYVMTFTQKTVSDESIFPTKYANEFPGSFESIARKILRLQFHVIAHLYAAHFREIALLGLHTHLNLTFAHLTALHRRFNLIDEKETDVLRDLEVALRLTDDNNVSSSSSNNQQQHQQLHSNSSNSDNNSTYEAGTNYAAAGAAATFTGGGNHSHQQQHAAAAMSLAATSMDDGHLMHHGATGIDGDASTQPICTQPEAKVGGCGGLGANNVFGGGGGLMGGILGDFTGSEFSDTSRYCTSAVPSSSSSSSMMMAANLTANSNNGAGALQHLNFNNNYAHAHHQHHMQQQQQHQQNHGLLQCNNTTQQPSPHNTTTA